MLKIRSKHNSTKQFILDYWYNSKMNRMFSFNLSIESITDLNVTKNDLLSAIDNLECFERSTRIYDRRNSCKYLRSQSLFILIWNIVQAFQALLLSFTDNETIMLYFGDFFVYSSERKFLNYIVHFGIIVLCIVKIFLLHLNRSDRKTFFNIYDEYKVSLQDPNKKFHLLQTDDKSFRVFYYVFIKLCKYISIGLCSVFLLFHVSNVIYNHSSLFRSTLQMIHLTLLLIPYYPILSSTIWFLSMLMIGGIFTYHSIVYLTSECHELISVGDYTFQCVECFHYKQTLLINWMDLANIQSAWIFMAIYVYGAFHSILLFFYLTQFTFNSLNVKMFFIFCNILLLTILYAASYLASLIAQKASLLHRSIYRLAADAGKSFNLKVALKIEEFKQFILYRICKVWNDWVPVKWGFMLVIIFIMTAITLYILPWSVALYTFYFVQISIETIFKVKLSFEAIMKSSSRLLASSTISLEYCRYSVDE